MPGTSKLATLAPWRDLGLLGCPLSRPSFPLAPDRPMLPLVVVLVTVALVWGSVYLRYTGLLGGCVAVLLCGSIFGHSFFHVGPWTSDRILVIGLVAGYAIWRYRGELDPKILARGDAILVLFLAVLLLSTFSHDWKAQSAKPVVMLAVFYGIPAIMYVVARDLSISERQMIGLTAFFALFGIYLALTAVAEKLELRPLIFPRYIMTATYSEFLGRGRGPYLNPCANGLYLTLGLAALWMLWPRLALVGRGGVLIASLGFGLGLYSTLTRCVWLGAALSSLLILAVHVPRSWRWPLLLIVMLMGGGLLGAKWQDLQAFKRDKHVSVEDMAKSASLRPMLATLAMQMFVDRPVLGCGFGQYRKAARPYFSARTSDRPISVIRGYVQHNFFLSLLTETGLAGAGLFAILLVTWAVDAWRLWSEPRQLLALRQQGLLLLVTLISYLISGMFQDMTIIPMVHVLLFFQAGLVRGLAPANQRAGRSASQVRPLPARSLTSPPLSPA